MLTNDQKILIEKSLGGIGVLCISGVALLLLFILSEVFTHDLESALWRAEDLFTHEGGFLLVLLAVVCLWLRAFLRAGRLGS